MCPLEQEADSEHKRTDSSNHHSSRFRDEETVGESNGGTLSDRLLLAFGGTALLSAAAVAGACFAGSVWTAATALLVGGLLAAGLSVHAARTIGRADPQSQDARDAMGEGIERMRVLTRLMNRTSGESDLEAAFRTFLGEVREATAAKYAALSIFDDDGEIDEFFTLGLTEEQREQIGHLPEGKGLLGHIQEEQELLHLDDMTVPGRPSADAVALGRAHHLPGPGARQPVLVGQEGGDYVQRRGRPVR